MASICCIQKCSLTKSNPIVAGIASIGMGKQREKKSVFCSKSGCTYMPTEKKIQCITLQVSLTPDFKLRT